MPLEELLGPGGKFHQALAVAPKPWKRDLFLFDVIDDLHVKHRYSQKQFDASSPALRSVAAPNLFSPPPYAEPAVPNLKVFLPGNGSPDGVTVATLRKLDKPGYRIASQILDDIQKAKPERKRDSQTFHQWTVEKNVIRYLWSRGFVATNGPLVVLAQATRAPEGPGGSGGIMWSAWVNADGSIVPLEGLYARFPDETLAIAIAVLLNVADAISTVLSQTRAVRNEGTRVPGPRALNAWHVPPLRDDRYQTKLTQLVQIFHAYRSRVSTLDEASALATTEYRELSKLGEELWRM